MRKLIVVALLALAGFVTSASATPITTDSPVVLACIARDRANHDAFLGQVTIIDYGYSFKVINRVGKTVFVSPTLQKRSEHSLYGTDDIGIYYFKGLDKFLGLYSSGYVTKQGVQEFTDFNCGTQL